MVERWQTAGFGLYVHWPFCQAKCPYCDFNSHVAATIDQDRWLAAYLTELDRLRAETGPRRLSSIFFGGGTPSLMDPRVVEAIIAAALEHWSAANDIEITLEANPTSVEVGRFQAYRAAGVNRVSIGIQALNDADLRKLGRMHDAQEGLQAIEAARTVFDRFSFDLIYARQGQTLLDWKRELTQALEIGADHLSLYQLTIEPGTVFGARHARGQLKHLPSEDLGADLYDLTQDLCDAAGLRAYEVSNHARPGQESLHNLIYWRTGDFAGIGPGAHGRLTFRDGARMATDTHRMPQDWLKAVEAGGTGELPRARLTLAETADEFLVMGLRLEEGIDLDELRALAGLEPTPASLASLVDMGLVQQKNRRLFATRQGRLLLNSVLQHIELERVPA